MAPDGRTERWTDGRTDGHGQIYIPPPSAENHSCDFRRYMSCHGSSTGGVKQAKNPVECRG